MGEPTILKDVDGVVTFTLTNKKNKQKESIEITTDRSDYFSYVHDTGYWYVYARHNTLPYVRRSIKKGNKTIYLHDLVINSSSLNDRNVTDHINGISLDNRRANLQRISNCENMAKGKNYDKRNINKGFNIGGIRITYVANTDGFQSYHKGTFIGYSKSKKIIQDKVIKYIKQMEQGGNNET